MLRPSGDQRAVPAVPCRAVNCAQLEPSLSQYQISENPIRSDSNTTFFPSGEKLGRQLIIPLAVITGVGWPDECVLSLRLMRQIPLFTLACSYASRLPFLEIDGVYAIVFTPATGRGCPPLAETRHKFSGPPRLDEKTISEPSWVQVGDPPQALS